MHQFTENINRGKKKKKKDRQDICQSDLQFTSGNNLAEGEERRVVQTEAFMVSSCTFSAAWGKSSAEHCQFREGPFCISHFRIRKVLLSNSKLAKKHCRRKAACQSRQTASVEWRVYYKAFFILSRKTQRAENRY